MTELERLLALEAACCAAEGCGSSDLKAALSLLQAELEKVEWPEPFGEFLDQQLVAVIKLAANPETFGH